MVRTVLATCSVYVLVLLLTGCSQNMKRMWPLPPDSVSTDSDTVFGAPFDVINIGPSSDINEIIGSPQRLLIWEAALTLEVKQVDQTSQNIKEIVTEAGGYLERSQKLDVDPFETEINVADVGLSFRIPAESLQETIERIAVMGRVQKRTIESTDVTEEVIDLEARLKNKTALRDRLKEILTRAEKVEDILKTEEQLNRIQTEIDRMQARTQYLSKQVAMAKLTVDLNDKIIPGPLGYVFKGLGLGLKWLFVIRD